MKLGLSLSNNQGIEEVHDIVRLAVSAEALGSTRSGPVTTSST
jgi:hypothetical protein